MIWQPLRSTGDEVKEYFLSFTARGKGSLTATFFYNSNRKQLPGKVFKLGKEWKNYSCTVDVSETLGTKSLFLKVNKGFAEIRDIKCIPVVLADNPDALKH